MTEREILLVNQLRIDLYDANYPLIFAVDKETLAAAEQAILENLENRGLPPIIVSGEHGPYFKCCELVLKV